MTREPEAAILTDEITWSATIIKFNRVSIVTSNGGLPGLCTHRHGDGVSPGPRGRVIVSLPLFFSRATECHGLLREFTVNFILGPLTLRYHMGRDIIER